MGGTSGFQEPLKFKLRQQLPSQSRATEEKRSSEKFLFFSRRHTFIKKIQGKQQPRIINYDFYLYFFLISLATLRFDRRHKTSFIAASSLSSSECGIALITHQVMALCSVMFWIQQQYWQPISVSNGIFFHPRFFPLLPTAAVGSECESPTASKAETRQPYYLFAVFFFTFFLDKTGTNRIAIRVLFRFF